MFKWLYLSKIFSQFAQQYMSRSDLKRLASSALIEMHHFARRDRLTVCWWEISTHRSDKSRWVRYKQPWLSASSRHKQTTTTTTHFSTSHSNYPTAYWCHWVYWGNLGKRAQALQSFSPERRSSASKEMHVVFTHRRVNVFNMAESLWTHHDFVSFH